jgi:hypothetical protein
MVKGELRSTSCGRLFIFLSQFGLSGAGTVAGTNFVGRTGHLERILAEDGKGRGPSIFFSVEGIPGIGKTRLADQLVDRAAAQGRTAVRIDCGDIPAWNPGGGAQPDEAAEFRQFRAVLRQAMTSLPDEAGDRSVITGYLDERARARAGYMAGAHSQVSAGPMDLGELLDVAISASTKLAETLARQDARLLVLVDDFHLIASRPLGRWILSWLSAVKEADVTVLHQELRDPAAIELPPGVIGLPLGNLTQEDVKAYLQSHEGIGPDTAVIDEPVWDFTHGHPQALVLAADLIKEIIKESGSIQRSIGIIRQIDAIQGGLTTQLEALVNRIVSAIEEELRDALYTLCIPRHFDRPLLQYLVDGLGERQAQTIIDRLRHYSFVEPATPQRPYLAITDFVREVIVSRLDPDPDRQQAIHLRTSEYYKNLMVAQWEEEDASYSGWYRYEKPDFQTFLREWLYHLGSLTGSRRQTGRTAMARIFFDAFWWWGSYVPYQFCEDLLADWSATESGDDDHIWGELLRTVYDKYPKAGQKITPEEWDDIRDTLLLIGRYGGFAGAQPEDRELRHVRGIIDFYLADAVRYTDPADLEADERLDDAGELFEADDDEWNLAWVEYTRADLAVMREQAELAISLVTQTAHDHPDLGDDELLANLNRVWSDAQWLLGNPAASLDAAARAVAHAYSFELTGATPDDYTAAFQQEMTSRAIERLAALQASDADQAILRAGIVRIHDFFDPYWRAIRQDPIAADGIDVVQALAEGRRIEVAMALFPAVPATTELNRQGTQYAKTCVRFRDRMTTKLAQPPGTPLAAAVGRAE